MAKYSLHNGVKIANAFVPETFGRLATLGPKFQVGDYVTKQVCLCACGTVHIATVASMKSGHTVSCGCYLLERTKETHTKHGHSPRGADGKLKRSPEYEAYHAMLGRCYGPNHSAYPNYGGRGICVFPEWLGPKGFITWFAYIGPKPHPKMTQERDNVDGNYEPGNVRWATAEEQANNTRANIFLAHAGKSQTIAQWADELGVVYETLYTRHKAGWDDEKALTTPVRKLSGKPKTS